MVDHLPVTVATQEADPHPTEATEAATEKSATAPTTTATIDTETTTHQEGQDHPLEDKHTPPVGLDRGLLPATVGTMTHVIRIRQRSVAAIEKKIIKN